MNHTYHGSFMVRKYGARWLVQEATEDGNAAFTWDRVTVFGPGYGSFPDFTTGKVEVFIFNRRFRECGCLVIPESGPGCQHYDLPALATA